MVRAELRSLRDSLYWDLHQFKKAIKKLHPSNRRERGYTRPLSGYSTEISQFIGQCNSFRAGPEYGAAPIYGSYFGDHHTLQDELDQYLAQQTVPEDMNYCYTNTTTEEPDHCLANIVQGNPDHCPAYIVQRDLNHSVVVNNKVCFDTTGAETELAYRYKRHENLGNVTKVPVKVYIPTNAAGITEPGRALDLFMEKTRSDLKIKMDEKHHNKKHGRRDSKVDMDMIDMNMTGRGSVDTVIFSPKPIHIIPRANYHKLENSADYLDMQGANIRTGRCASGTWISEENGWKYIEDEHIENKQMEERHIGSKQMEQKQMEQKQMEERNIGIKQMEERHVEVKQVEEKHMENKQMDERYIGSKKMEQKQMEERHIEVKHIESKNVEEMHRENKQTEEKHLEHKPSLMQIVRDGLGDWADGEETIREKRERRHRRSFR